MPKCQLHACFLTIHHRGCWQVFLIARNKRITSIWHSWPKLSGVRTTFWTCVNISTSKRREKTMCKLFSSRFMKLPVKRTLSAQQWYYSPCLSSPALQLQDADLEIKSPGTLGPGFTKNTLGLLREFTHGVFSWTHVPSYTTNNRMEDAP